MGQCITKLGISIRQNVRRDHGIRFEAMKMKTCHRCGFAHDKDVLEGFEILEVHGSAMIVKKVPKQ